MTDDSLSALAAVLQCRRIPGGCDDCTAFQTMTQDGPGVYRLTVHHDDTCPSYRAMTNRAERRRRGRP